MAKDNISDELIAAFLDGTASKKEVLQVLQALKTDKELREILDVAMHIDDDTFSLTATYLPRMEVLPLTQLAAKSGENICAVLCEIFILQRRGMSFDEQQLLNRSRKSGWLRPAGTPLYCLGNLLASYDLPVVRRYDASLDDIRQALLADHDIIVGVDREKLYDEEDLEDAANHALVVTQLTDTDVTFYDPGDEPHLTTVLTATFLRAWQESRNHLIQVLRSKEEYVPHPIAVNDIILNQDLDELTEALAENAHDVWAEARIKEGWTYGPERDDSKRQHPDLVPYSSLPESEKEYDRVMALNTLKLVNKLGFTIGKK